MSSDPLRTAVVWRVPADVELMQDNLPKAITLGRRTVRIIPFQRQGATPAIGVCSPSFANVGSRRNAHAVLPPAATAVGSIGSPGSVAIHVVLLAVAVVHRPRALLSMNRANPAFWWLLGVVVSAVPGVPSPRTVVAMHRADPSAGKRSNRSAHDESECCK